MMENLKSAPSSWRRMEFEPSTSHEAGIERFESKCPWPKNDSVPAGFPLTTTSMECCTSAVAVSSAISRLTGALFDVFRCATLTDWFAKPHHEGPTIGPY